MSGRRYPRVSLAPLLFITERDVVAERWRQLRDHGHERRDDADWLTHLYVAHAVVGLGPEQRREALIRLAERALAWVEDLDHRAGVPARLFPQIDDELDAVVETPEATSAHQDTHA